MALSSLPSKSPSKDKTEKDAGNAGGKKKWIIGMSILLAGTPLATSGFFLDRNCNLVSEQLKGFFTLSLTVNCNPAHLIFYASLIIVGITLAVAGIVFLLMSLETKTLFLKSVTHVRFLVGGATVAAFGLIIITSAIEYVPINQITTAKGNGEVVVYVTRPATVLIPIRGIFQEQEYHVDATVFYDTSKVSEVYNVKLSSAPDSTLTYSNFRHTGNPSSESTTYDLVLKARHGGEVMNTSSLYTIEVFYLNNTKNPTPTTLSTTFGWPIQMLDFDMVVYFLIVFIGVLVSRYTTKHIEKIRKEEKDKVNQPATFEEKDYVWIIVSTVITLLIFSSFQQQVHLTSLIITNISLAFAFGFGFDKILATGTQAVQASK